MFLYLFGEERSMPEKRTPQQVLDIVFDMLATDVPESKVLSVLLQMGLSEQEARALITAAKAKLEKYLESRLAVSIDKLLETRKKEIEEYLAAKLAETQKQIQLQNELKFMEEKNFVEDRVSSLKSEVDSLKQDVFAARTELGGAVQQALTQTEVLGMKTAPRILSILLLAGGLFSAVASVFLIKGVLDQFAPGVKAPSLLDVAPSLLLYSVFLLLSLVIIKVGINLFQIRPKK